MGEATKSVRSKLLRTDIGQAIIDVLDEHPYWQMDVWLKRICEKLIEQRAREESEHS